MLRTTRCKGYIDIPHWVRGKRTTARRRCMVMTSEPSGYCHHHRQEDTPNVVSS